MKKAKGFKKAFRLNEVGMIDFPTKLSNVRISRIIYGDAMGCARCFPHGFETINSTIANRQRTWKKYPRAQWKEERKETPEENTNLSSY